MVDILQAEGISRYYHVAWADDANGLNFSLTEYDGAVMIGTYNDDSGTESTDPTDYTWQIIGTAESDGDGDPATAAAENEINALAAAVDDLTARTLTNAGNIDTANDASITGIGQPNLLSGTNRGADGWTGSGFTLAAVTGTVYNETDSPISWLMATCTTPGALSFSADGFRAILAEDSDTDTYTLSCDLRMSALSAVNVSMSDADGTNTQIDFGTADNASEILDDLHDLAGTWVHHALTAQIVDGNTESAQVLLFDCSNMTAGDTIEIANLKVEGGAIATPWKASAEEAMTAANEALSIAGNTNQYFWHTETGSDTGAHITEIPKDDFIADPTSGGGNLLARSNGIAVRDGLTELATFGASGAQIGRTGAAHSVIDADGQRFYASDGTTQLANIGYGQGQGGGGSSIATAPFYTLGLRGSDMTTSRGNWSVVEGFQNTANGYGSHAEGYQTAAYGDLSHTEGYKSEARNTDVPTSQGAYLQAASHAEGYQSIATGQASHAEGYQTNSNNAGTHSEGYGTTASGYYSHAEGYNTTASGATAHASGASTTASGDNSTAIGLGTTAQRRGQLCAGEYNKLDTGGANAGTRGNYAFIVGNGAGISSRSDALTVDWSGNLTAAGDITDGGGNVLSNKIDATTLADYVTEQGTSGSWRYRKWNSGKIEAWFEGTFSCAASTTARGALYYSTWTLSIPTAIGFSGTPNTLIGNTGDSATVIAVNGAATSTTAISGKVWRYASSSSALTISSKIYAWQD